MASVTLKADEIALRDVVGTHVLLQGRTLARSGRVKSVWVDAENVVSQVGDQASSHEVRMTVIRRPDGPVEELEGFCTCGRAVPCPHAVATLLAAASDGGRVPQATAEPQQPDLFTGLPAEEAPRPLPKPVPPPWAVALDSALADHAKPARAARSRAGSSRTIAPPDSGPQIALQFEVTADPAARIVVRPVVPGRAGGWVRSGVSWGMLQYPSYYFRHVPAAQLALLKELYALPTASLYGHPDKVVVLDTITSRRVWDVLLETQEVGLPLVTAERRAARVVVHADRAVATLDVRRVETEVVIAPLLAVAGRPVSGHVVIGTPPHGIAWPTDANGTVNGTPNGTVNGAAGGGLALARLASPPPELFKRLLGRAPLRVPADDEAQFFEEFYPQLAQRLTIVCRDGSVDLPAARPPMLSLTVTAAGGHRVTLTWAWTYTLGTTRRSEPLPLPSGRPADRIGPTTGGRDAAAERRLLDDVTPLLSALPALVDDSADQPQPRAHAELDGLDTARFMTHVLPRLEAHPGLEIAVVRTGDEDDAPEYREVDSVPVIRFAADEDDSAGLGPQDWFDLAVTVTVDDHPVPFGELFMALAQGQPTLLLDNGMYFSLDRPEFDQLAKLIAESRELLDAPPGTVRLNRFHVALWDDVERLGEITGQVDAWRQAVQSISTAVELPDHKLPGRLQASLRPYQEQGFGWLAALFGLRLGGILADDMGLGKTLQALSLILHVREQALVDAPFLVVAPTSVVGNWAAETRRFAPDLEVTTITQTAARRGHDLATAVTGAHLVITSYTLFRLEFDEYKAREWAGLLLDEAQNVKNHQSSGYRCARELPADFKLAITGTPMENNLMELWSLLSITAPGLFPRADRFTQHYRTPIEREHDTERLAQLRSRIRPLMLRRTKDQVAGDLPDRQEQVMELELNPRHRTLYQRYLQRERQKVLGLLGDFNRNRFEIFRSLTLLRQLSLDASLVDPKQSAVPSTKLDALLDHLDGIVAEGHRVLVFSQFTRFLGRARERLVAAGIDHCYLDGTTRNRARVISRFRDGKAPVFLISLKAGGAGLNLTEADYVILLDPWWNPATEAQAVDRAHRIGQTRKVMVYRMVAKDTIEEKVMALKERKAALTASVLAGEDFATATLTADDVRGLLA